MKGERVVWGAGLLAGLVVGLSLSLTYTWVLDPPSLTFTKPALLNLHDKELYAVLIAAVYSVDGNLERAKARLARLEDASVDNAIISMAEHYVIEGRDVRDVRALARLADALGQTSAVVRPFMAAFTPTLTPLPASTLTPIPTRPAATLTRIPASSRTPTTMPAPTQTATPPSTSILAGMPIAAPTWTPTATATPTRIIPRTPTPAANSYRVAQSTALCDAREEGLLRVYVRDGAGQPVPGIQILVDWPGGSDRFFTGLKPEVDTGYADFEMEPGEVYQVGLVDVLSEVGRDVGGDASRLCPALSNSVRPGWQVVFQLPGR
jgi:hypothetical protein